MLYITSSESEEFWRPYAGQSNLLKRRIPQHITEVLHGRINTLCYWIASKPGRQLNFIRLWDVTEVDEDTHQSIEVLNSLLEMIFCLAFQSLPLPTLERFLGAGTQSFSLRGLNVVSPLLQNVILTTNERSECRSWLAHSPSSETQDFVKARQAQLQQKKTSALQPCSRRPHPQEIELACRAAISPHLSSPFVGDKAKIGISINSRQPVDTTTIDHKVARYLDQQGVMEHLHALPFGSMTEARIGFVLDFDIFSLNHNRESIFPVHFPSALGYIGFDKQNCLVWPFNFQVPYTPRKFKLAGPEDKFLREINREIIDLSSLQVVMLCGANAERLIVMSDPSIKKIKIDIGKVSLDAFLQIQQPQSVVSRVYLTLPAPLSALHSSDWKGAAMASLAIKVGACLTQTRGIYPSYFRSRVALSELVLTRLREEKGEFKMTIDSITDNIWSWLHDWGFQASDLPRLEILGGSVSRGILLAMINSRWRRKGEHRLAASRPRPFPNDNTRFCHSFTQSQHQEMKAFHLQK